MSALGTHDSSNALRCLSCPWSHLSLKGVHKRGYHLRAGALSFVTGSGLLAVGVSAFYVFQDWAALNSFYARFQALVMSNASLRSLFIAQANQGAFRINCFADGVGVLLGGLIAAVGIHGLCCLKRD